jgi:Na+-driven multidrug efflux pump
MTTPLPNRHNLQTLFLKEKTGPLRLTSQAESLLDNDGFSSNNTLISNEAQSDTAVFSSQEEDSTSSVSNDNESTSHQLPSYRQLVVYTLATVAIWMAEPLLSLVDTTVVGLTQGATSTVQVASMGPATTLFDSVLYGCWFLAVATTSQVAQALAKQDYHELQTVVRNALGVSLSLGFGVTAFLMLGGPSILQTMVQSSASAPMLVQYASQYTRIRALVAIPAIASQVLQSTCLATLDVRTPAIAVLVASVVNIVGDLVLSPTMGVVGAAWATAAATVASTGILFHAVMKQMQQWEVKANEKVSRDAWDDEAPGGKVPMLAVSSPGLWAKGWRTVSSMFSLPNGQQFMELLRLSGPLFYAINAKLACYSALTIRCAPFGVTAMAAFNIMMRIFCSFACFGYSLSQAAQSFVPAALLRNDETKNFRGIMKRLFLIGAIMAFINQGATFTLSQFGRFFTTDPGVISMLHDSNMFLGLALVLHPVTMLLEGAVIGMRDFKSLVATYTITLGVHLGVLKFFTNSLSEVWRAFFIFQLVTMSLYSGCIWTRKAVKNKIKMSKDALVTL